MAVEGLPFCVLRNYSGFPSVNEGSDIDLLLEPPDLPRAVRALRSISGIQLIAFAQRPYVANLIFHGVAAHPGSECIEIDFDLSLPWKGLPFLDVKEILEKARPRIAGNLAFLIPSPEHEAILSLFLSLLLSGFIKEKYLPDVQAVFSSASQEVYSALAPRFGKTASRQVIDAVVSGDRARILACVGPLQRALFWRVFFRRPAQAALAMIRHYAQEIRFRFSPNIATDISIASADESRRNQLIAALAPMLEPATVLLETQSGPAGQTSTRLASVAAADHSSRIRIFHLLRWILTGWLRKIAPKKHLTIRLHANYCFDWLARPKTAGNGMPTWRERLAARLSPRPSLLIALSASGPTSLQSAAGKLRCVKLDASRPIAELAEEAYAAILALLAERAEQRIRRCA